MAQLSELLPVEAIRLDVPAGTWPAAVRAAGDLLVMNGVSTDAYTAEMVRNVEENGPYIVVAPGFAFAHARPSPAVLRTGMSWVRLVEPVEFGHETNDPVGLVVALAAGDSAAHTAAMASLARLLADAATVQALDVSPTPEAVRQILIDAEAREERSAGRPAGVGGGGVRGGGGAQKILTVCGNGVGTSMFLKSTLDKVLDRWKWGRYVTTEATDTISAKGKASEAVAILTSREIARTLGDVGVPVRVIEDFTSAKEVDGVLRDLYGF